MHGYIGETDAKRIARAQLYRRIASLQAPAERREGMAVVLAGPDAGEVGCLKHVLRVRPWQVLFVDNRETEGLAKARRQWPGVHTYCGDILDALQNLQAPLFFANLDFMGYLNDHRRRTVEAAGRLLKARGVLSYTFFRGREAPGRGNWDALRSIRTHRRRARIGNQSARDMPTWDERRMIGYTQEIQSLMGGTQAEPIFMLRYDSKSAERKERHAPMAVLAFQHMPAGLRTAEWEAALSTTPNEGSRGGSLPRKHLDEALRNQALAYLHEGWNCKEVAELMTLPVGTIMAWKAHETRGTYEGE